MIEQKKQLVWLAVLLLVLGATPTWAERILMYSPGARVTLEGPLRCGEPISVGVVTEDPELFQGEVGELQRMLDGVRAMLSYECSRTRKINVLGRLKGLDDPVYQGVVGQDSRWLVQAVPIVRAKDIGEEHLAASAASEEAGERLSVANLSLGMSVPEARAAVRRTFGVEPQFDAERRLLTMYAQGCPKDFDWTHWTPAPEAGWKCVRARFSREAEPRLYLLELVQALEGNQAERAEQALRDRFGKPVRVWTEPRKGTQFESDQELKHLAWGDVMGKTTSKTDDQPERLIYELEVVLGKDRDALVTVVTLYNPTLQSGPRSLDPAADLDFKL